VSDSKTVQRGTEAEIRHRDKVWQEFVAERGRRYANCRFTNWEADAGSSKAAAVDTVGAYVGLSVSALPTVDTVTTGYDRHSCRQLETQP